MDWVGLPETGAVLRIENLARTCTSDADRVLAGYYLAGQLLSEGLDVRRLQRHHLIDDLLKLVAEARHVDTGLFRRQIDKQIDGRVEEVIAPLFGQSNNALQIGDADAPQRYWYLRAAALHIVLKRGFQPARGRPDACPVYPLQQVAGGLSQQWMPHRRRDLGQRHQHKSPLGHARVRNDKTRFVQHQVVVE